MELVLTRRCVYAPLVIFISDLDECSVDKAQAIQGSCGVALNVFTRLIVRDHASAVTGRTVIRTTVIALWPKEVRDICCTM